MATQTHDIGSTTAQGMHKSEEHHNDFGRIRLSTAQPPTPQNTGTSTPLAASYPPPSWGSKSNLATHLEAQLHLILAHRKLETILDPSAMVDEELEEAVLHAANRVVNARAERARKLETQEREKMRVREDERFERLARGSIGCIVAVGVVVFAVLFA
ncbi:hypothetical protein BJ508DRAFT_325099 [Ascobolus immersus RN42]|uniref:Uncharacterized protein n=1 Tax=Ascobolus immersus RN42 TaxID=1160509 RepID=A0A3N4IFM5_ASCIM|nr:hypothetical protein BJ508DRAFT_325099 [Ascobolus immersus RN42]